MGNRHFFPVQMELEGSQELCNEQVCSNHCWGPGSWGQGQRVQPVETKECPFHFFFLSLSVTHTFVLKFLLLSFP